MTTGGGDLHELHWETRQVYLALHLHFRTVSDELFFLREFTSGDIPELLIFKLWVVFSEGFPGSSAGKEATCYAGDLQWVENIPWRRDRLPTPVFLGFPATWETWVRSLPWEDPLEWGMAPHSSILAWRIPWAGKPGGPQSTASQRVGHSDQARGTRCSLHLSLFWVVVVQPLSRVQHFATPWTAARQASLSSTISWSLLKLMSTESVMPSNQLNSVLGN